ncbi:MAG: 3-keto-5-aminohexanoate cleavage protein [Candidatus Helarchaeota archaeon]
MQNNKIMITVTTANSWIYPDVKNWPVSVDDLIDTVIKCHKAGAAIAHIHLIKGKEKEIVDRIRDECDIIIQAGMSSDPLEDRTALFEAKPDMVSVILSHHDECFTNLNVYRLHPREELERYCKVCKDYGIKPEWEVWHHGSIWNLNYLIGKGLLEGPHFLSVFFNWPGGSWSPPDPGEYFHRVKYFPTDSIHTVSTMGPKQKIIATLAISYEGHIRVGTEDYPFIKENIPAKDNAEIIKHWVTICEKLERPIATPSEARKIIGI